MRVFLIASLALVLSGHSVAYAQSEEGAAQRQAALGIGGLFVRAKDPAASAARLNTSVSVVWAKTLDRPTQSGDRLVIQPALMVPSATDAKKPNFG